MASNSSKDGLNLTAHRGEGAALLAFDVDESLHEDLAGFALRYRSPEGDERPIYNRLTFTEPVTAETTPDERRAIASPTDHAPLQKFHWVHLPRRVPEGDLQVRRYRDEVQEPVGDRDRASSSQTRSSCRATPSRRSS